MKISELYKQKQNQKQPMLSFEVFPPKKTSSVETVYAAINKLSELKPDFISVTYGAGGSLTNNFTRDIAASIKNGGVMESMAHLTCVNNTKEEVLTVLKGFKEAGIDNILALRGDIVPDIPRKTDFAHACDLIAFIKEQSEFDFGISAACYPEGHTEAASLDEDIKNLKNKVDAGAEHLVSQLFFDNDFFYSFIDKARAKGINVPICAGIMPVTSKSQIERMVTLCGASLPHKFVKMINRYADKPEALIDAGIAYAADQIADLLSSGVDGIHLYTMNNPYVANKIVEITGKLF